MTADRFARRTTMAGERRGREFSLEWGEQSRFRELRVWHALVSKADALEAEPSLEIPDHLGSDFPAIAGIQVTWIADDGTPMISPVLGAVPLRSDGSVVPWDDATVLGDGDIINGLWGHGGGGRIYSIGVVTQHAPLPPAGSPVGSTYGWSLESMLGAGLDRMPPDALISGLFGCYDPGGLRGIGLRCMVDGVPPLVLRWGPGGRVVPVADAGKPPRVDDTRAPAAPSESEDNADRDDHIGEPTHPTARPNPNHRPIDVRRIDQWDDTLRIHALDGTSEEFSYVGRGIDQGARRWTNEYSDLGGRTAMVHIGSDNAWIDVPDGAEVTTFAKPVLPPPAASDGPTWDNVFSLDHRVDYLGWLFRGLDISLLAPFNFQDSKGVLQQAVFRAPAPGSRDFHIANNGKATVVPNGWQFVGDIKGRTGSRTASSFSDEESRRTWATSLGISAEADGLGAKAAYSNNHKAHNELSSASSGKRVSTIIEKVQTDHSLVVDLATVELASGFRLAVDDLKASPTQGGIATFIAQFGTHFASSVTYGSKEWEQRHETEASVADSMMHGTSQDQSVQAGYHNEIGGASGSVSWGSENQSAKSTKRGTGSEVSSQGSVGSPSEPVPIVMEVKPLTHLLSPIFFDDPYVYVDLRQQVDDYLDEFPLGPPPLGPPYNNDATEGLDFAIAPAEHPDFVDAIGKFGQTVAWIHSGVWYPLEGDAVTYMKGADSPRVYQNLSSGFLDNFRPSKHPPTTEGKAVRFSGDDRLWWIRGGRRHWIANNPGDFSFLPPTGFRGGVDATDRDRYPDSAVPVTVEGKLMRATTGRKVWWIDNGERHLVPSEAVVEVLGGWELVASVSEGYLEQFAIRKKPVSVEGKMIRVADHPQVWVIHERELHRITELDIRNRGGWQQVAVVRPDVLAWFPAA